MRCCIGARAGVRRYRGPTPGGRCCTVAIVRGRCCTGATTRSRTGALDRVGLVDGRRQPRNEELHQGLVVVPGGHRQEAIMTLNLVQWKSLLNHLQAGKVDIVGSCRVSTLYSSARYSSFKKAEMYLSQSSCLIMWVERGVCNIGFTLFDF